MVREDDAHLLPVPFDCRLRNVDGIKFPELFGECQVVQDIVVRCLH